MIALRSILFQIFFWTFSVIINVLWLPSLAMPRRAVVRGMELWSAITFWGLKTIVGLDYEVRGGENIVAGGALYAGKHLSMWETMAPHVLLKDPALILKRELLSVPLYGWYARKAQMIVIDRDGRAKSIRTMIAAAKACVAQGRPIVIFPEGTRRQLGAAPDYKPGVAALYAALDLPCIPIAHNSGLYWPRRGFLRKPGKIIVEFLPAVPAHLSRAEFMSELERRLEAGTAKLLVEGGFRPGGEAPADRVAAE